jgi:ABC-2 type transport system ATP-binding protein
MVATLARRAPERATSLGPHPARRTLTTAAFAPPMVREPKSSGVTAAIRAEALRKVYAGARGRGRPASGPAPVPTGAGQAAGSAAVVALEGLDLEIGAGEFFGLLGPNGAGKTTTIGMLTTRVRPTAGRATVAGADVVAQPSSVRQRIGVVPQRPNPDRSLTVRENLLFHAAYFGVPGAVAGRRADQLLARFGLAGRDHGRVQQLSGGLQQRLMIARALIHEPQILFLDEPTVGLDPQARLSLWEILRELHGQGRTIVMTTHYMEEADRLCERLAIVDRGRLLVLETPAGLKAMAPGGTLIEITLDGEAAAVADAARAVPGVSRAEPEGARLRVSADKPGEVLAGLIRAAETAGRTVQNIHLAPPSLETLFIALTGRALD